MTMDEGRTLYFLIGPKGSGKTYIGSAVDKHTEIAFLSVEPIWMALSPDQDGWTEVEQAVEKAFEQNCKVMIESLGAGAGFHRFFNSVKQKYRTKMIRVFADLDTCLKRIENRDSTEQIPISIDKIQEFNQIASKVEFDWSFEINNNGPAPIDQIVEAFKSIN